MTELGPSPLWRYGWCGWAYLAHDRPACEQCAEIGSPPAKGSKGQLYPLAYSPAIAGELPGTVFVRCLDCRSTTSVPAEAHQYVLLGLQWRAVQVQDLSEVLGHFEYFKWPSHGP
jgi:hypothetical protein